MNDLADDTDDDDLLPSVRLLGHAIEAPVEGVPAYLRPHLREWLLYVFRNAEKSPPFPAFALHLRVTWSSDPHEHDEESLLDAVERQRGEAGLLDLAETALRTVVSSEEAADVLGRIFSLAGSAYTVSPDRQRIVRRVHAQAEVAVRKAVEPEGEASKHLAKAWNSAFGRDPDAQVAWQAATRAVEATAIPLLWPDPDKRGRRTLSHVVRRLRDEPAQWRLGPDVGDSSLRIATLADMLDTLTWDPQRHGADGHEPATLEQAAAMVHLAVCLVSWLRDGLLERVQP